LLRHITEESSMRLHGIEIPVVDLDRAYGFYAKVLEFPVVGRFSESSAVFFLSDVHGGMVTLVTTSDPPDGHGVVLVLSSEGGIDETKARLEARGVVFLDSPKESGAGRTAHFRDSEGNRLALFESTMAHRFRDAAKKSNAEVRAGVGELEASLSAVIEGVRATQAAYRPAPEEWPILGHLGHVVDTLDSCGVVAHDLAAGRQPPRDRLLERDYPMESLDAARTELKRAFSDARRWVEELPTAADGQTRLVHGVFGELSAREWVAFMLFHVGMHIGQIEEIKASPAYPSGK
jgi:uncharacterized protein